MRIRWRQFWLSSLPVAAAALWVATSLPPRFVGAEDAASPSAANVDFVRDIQPLFAAHCYKCHDAAKHKGGLRLDSKATAFIGGDSGDASIVAGDPDHSKLIQLVRGDDPNSVMPPKGKRLSPEQVDLLVRWVKARAPWPDGVDHPSAALTHWSFKTPVRPPIPQVKHGSQVRNPVDNFVLAKLEEHGIGLSPEADRYALARRVSLDLIGLPPSPAEVDAFVNDHSADAYERLVDRLLANPHFGERWARHWLDLARYADSAGYGSDPLRTSCFRYRDWVIDAFNRNLPYDQFTIEQIAGDLLPKPTTDQLIATCFNRNTMTNTEGGTDAEEYRNEAIKDRTDTTLQVWMGLTMGCAKCHTHKYDPITNREYYQVFAFFNQSEDANRGDEAPTLATPTVEQEAKIKLLNEQIAHAEARLKDPSAWTSAEADWEKTVASQQPNWVVRKPSAATSRNGAVLKVQDDGSILASGNRPSTDVYTAAVETELKGITAFRVEVLPDASQPHGGVGRHDNGGFVLNEFHLGLTPSTSAATRGRFVRIELPGHEKILSLAEVQVMAGAENIALKGKATQSSTDFDGPPNLAIDGNTNGDFKVHSTTHTAKSDNPWWELDLASVQEFDHITLWNRTDSSLQSRLSDFRVAVLDENRNAVWDREVAAAPNPSLALDVKAPRKIALKDASDTFHQTVSGDWSAANLLAEGKGAQSGWAVFPEVSRAHAAVFETVRELSVGTGSKLTFDLVQNFPDAPVGKFRISATTSPRPVRVLPETVSDALAVAPEHRSKEQSTAVFDYFLANAPQLKAERDRVAQLKTDLSGIKPVMTAIMRDLPANQRRQTHVLTKGNFLVKGPLVEPQVLAAFHPLPKDAPVNRLGLAKWLVDTDNPLTSRVEVNRLWAQLFSVGLVETQEDFGTQGTLPSNQPLLDWLATEFAAPVADSNRRPWDMKAMIRLMVTSATYRQSSRTTPELLAEDPTGRLLSRFPSKRLEAELVRDQALALSGLLSPKMFGPSVFPPQPEGLWQAAFNGERTYPTSTGEDRYRRGLYTFWRRTVPYPSMAAFDAPSREVCTIRRIQTSTPLQAFVTLNDPCYVECAQGLARRIILEGGATPEQRAAFALALCLQRPPEPQQQQRLLSLYQREFERYQADPKTAEAMATGERGPLPSGMDASTAAAWTVCANVLLNMDGVLTKR